MILFDFQCLQCEYVKEYLVDRDTESMECPMCGHVMKKSFLNTNRLPDDAPWLKSVLEVVEKNPGPDKPRTREFLKNPTRENYKAWMKENGIRPADYNGPASTVSREEELRKQRTKIIDDLTHKHIEREAITVGRR